MMRPEYDGVMFYGKNDMSIDINLEKADHIIKYFSIKKEYTDINEVLELYVIKKLYNTGIKLFYWTDEEYIERKNMVFKMSSTIGKFFSKINDSNFIDIEENVCAGYIESFWEIFTINKIFNNISSETFSYFLDKSETSFNILLKHKELVKAYDNVFTEKLKISNQTAELLVTEYFEYSKYNYYFPHGLSKDEYEKIIQHYIDSGSANPNVLQLIYNSQRTDDCPISDKLRINAKKEYERFWRENDKNTIAINYEINIKFSDQCETVLIANQGNKCQYSYDIKWFECNLDYPTILNNFIYVFNMFDSSFRSNLVSVGSNISAVEKVFITKGRCNYTKGNYFDYIKMLSNAQTMAYYEFLLDNKIYLEEVFSWFFEKYLPNEFVVKGFSMNATSLNASYIEKCRSISSEMEGILKQFTMFVNNGEIDRELFEISSEHLVISSIPTLIKRKYAYPNNETILNEMLFLFSDQAVLSYTKKTKTKYNTLYELLVYEKMYRSDFEKYQQIHIDWLIENNCLLISTDEIITINENKVNILKDLYRHDVICLYKLNKLKETAMELVSNGELRIGNTLFSEPEIDYLNFMLNKSKYSNGFDLRNKYAHSTYSQNEDEQKNDYMELIKIMVMIITKINDEFCEKKEMTI